MLLDGREVPAAWDAQASMVVYAPPSALAPGTYQVKLTVQVSHPQPNQGWRPLVQEFSFTVRQDAVASLPAPDAEGRRALAYANEVRHQAGLSPLQWAPELAAAAQAHARYLKLNPNRIEEDAHSEVEGDAGFSGRAPGDRARFYTWSAGVSEVIHFEGTAEEGIDGWMESLYHRLPFVQPGTGFAGFATAGPGPDFVQVMMLGATGEASEGYTLWPADGAIGVALGWSGRETPDPFRLYGGLRGPVGYTVTATFGGRGPIQMQTMTLTAKSTGTLVPTYSFTPQNDEYLSDTVALIPQAPLEPLTTYEVYMAGSVDGQPWSRRWSFTTGDEMLPDLRRREVIAQRVEYADIRVIGRGYQEGMEVFLAGLPVRSLEVESETTMRFRTPSGFDPAAPSDLTVVMPGGREAVWPLFFTGGELIRTAASPAPFVPAPVFVNGQRHLENALVHPEGVLVPESALFPLGRREQIPETGRVYWTVGERVASFLPGRAAYWMDGRLGRGALPVRTDGGRHYVSEQFVRGLTSGRVLVLTDLGGHWSEPLVSELVGKGVVGGYEDWTYRPDATITRGAFVKMLVTARQFAPQPGETGGLSDTGGHWIADHGWIGAAVDAGIVRPDEYVGRRFEPDRPIARNEMAVMVIRALGRDSEAVAVRLNGDVVGGRRFADVTQWRFPGHVAVAVELGIITGYPDAPSQFTFRPEQAATRAEAAAMVTRMLTTE